MIDSNSKILDTTLNLFKEDISDSIKLGIVQLKADYSINIVNICFMNMFFYKKDELQNKSIKLLFKTDDFKTLENHMKTIDEEKNISIIENFKLNGLRQNKTIIPLEITIFKFSNNLKHMFILIMKDISEFKKSIKDLQYRAYYDQLTQIPNRTLFSDRAETAIRIARREDEKIAIVYIDIDEFKIINDTMGHEGGDIVLKELSKRFQESVRDSDTVSRVGGDEFAILMLKITSYKDPAIVAKRILKSNLLSIKINNKYFSPKTSIGISIFPKDGNNFNKLLKNADKAMYCAKRNGKNQYLFYKSNMIGAGN